MACQKKEEGERERGNTNPEREKHLTVHRVREELAFIFPSRRFFSVELNKFQPFPLGLSPPPEDPPESELFADISRFTPHGSAW